MPRSLLSFQRFYIHLFEKIRKGREAATSCEPLAKQRKLSEAEASNPNGYVCGTCVAIAGLKRDQEKMKEILLSGQELIPMAWIQLKDFMPLNVFGLRNEIEQKKSIEGMAKEYLKNMKGWDHRACRHFDITFENDDEDRSEVIWLPLIWIFGKERFCGELRILLLYSSLDVRQEYITLLPIRRKTSIILELVKDSPPTYLMEFQWFFFSLLERVLKKRNVHLFEIILETRPKIITQDVRNIPFEPSLLKFSHGPKLTMLGQLYRNYPNSYFLIQKAILYGADLNNKSNETTGLLEVPNFAWDNVISYFSHQVDGADLFISHGLMDFRNNAQGSIILALLEFFYSYAISDMHPDGVQKVESLILTAESLGYQFYGFPGALQKEELKLRTWRELGTHLWPTRRQILEKHLQRMYASPMSLKAAARNVVRFALGGEQFLMKLQAVPLPEKLKEFVRCITPPKRRTR